MSMIQRTCRLDFSSGNKMVIVVCCGSNCIHFLGGFATMGVEKPGFISWSNKPFPRELQASQGFGRCHKSSTWCSRTGAHRLKRSNRPTAVPESKQFNTAPSALVSGLVQRQHTWIQTLWNCRVVCCFSDCLSKFWWNQTLLVSTTYSWFQVLAVLHSKVDLAANRQLKVAGCQQLIHTGFVSHGGYILL